MEKSVSTGSTGQEVQRELTTQVKELLVEPKHRIALHDLVVRELKKVNELTSDDCFAIEGQSFSKEAFSERVVKYMEITKDLRFIAVCLGYWGENIHSNVLALIHSRLVDRIEVRSGLTIWLTLRWYPLILTLYSTGVAALAAKNYANLAAVFWTNVCNPTSSQGRVPLVHAIGNILLEMNQSNGFQSLPGYEQHYFPRSEYLFKVLQPELNDLLYLGQDYEDFFDQFEIFLNLSYSYSCKQKEDNFWAPMGRFAWKSRRRSDNPFNRVIIEAEAQRNSWQPLQTGLFGTDYEQFNEISKQLAQNIGRM